MTVEGGLQKRDKIENGLVCILEAILLVEANKKNRRYDGKAKTVLFLYVAVLDV